MATLTEAELDRLFSGAPQFFARSEGHNTGAPHPSVAFPQNEELSIRDLCDHIQIENRAWSSVTAWPHITRDVQADHSVAMATKRATERQIRAHFYPRCRERPNMLSMAGLEKGTIGYQAALEMAVADALQEDQWGFEALATRPAAIHEQRQRMLTSKDGLRHLDENTILELMIRNSTRYSEQNVRTRKTSRIMYNELFLHVLHPPHRVLDQKNPYSLSVQIQALVQVLATPNVWIDFSKVDWRIRLGQLLWGTAPEEADEGASMKIGRSAADLQVERYWLLLQILLASELVLRLDAITEGEELGLESIKSSEILRFERIAQLPVRWAINLARSWLDNIDVVKNECTKQTSLPDKAQGWLAQMTKRMFMSQIDPQADSQRFSQKMYAFKGRHAQRQVAGLRHFARQLRWPDIDNYATKITDNCQAVIEGTPMATPLASPTSVTDSQRGSYFGGCKGHANIERAPTRRRRITATLNSCGWLSKSYLSGLLLPGETLSHALMSCLLENDKDAMSRLGPLANLCGGFFYRQKSFWSTQCVVGRVLAAAKGSAESMSWISSDIVSKSTGDGWVNIEVHELPDDIRCVNKKARLWSKTDIEREGALLGDAKDATVSPADFVIPLEDSHRVTPPDNMRIDFKSLNLGQASEDPEATPSTDLTATPYSDISQLPQVRTFSASISFTFSAHDKDYAVMKAYTYTLSNDVYFVTAHPCVPSQHIRIMKSPTSPTIQQVDLLGDGFDDRTSKIICHPLHRYFTFASIHLSELIDKQDLMLEALLTNSTNPSSNSGLPKSSECTVAKVLVIDCITGFQPAPQEHEIPLSPVISRSSNYSNSQSESSSGLSSSPPENGGAAAGGAESAGRQMHQETRRRHFGSDMEMLVRALCVERGWNALISRRRRGCLACAIREAGALGWKVIIRVD